MQMELSLEQWKFVVLDVNDINQMIAFKQHEFKHEGRGGVGEGDWVSTSR